jgi:hypothetical protein
LLTLAFTSNVSRLGITFPFDKFMRQAQISILEISNIFLRLKFNKIEHSAKASFLQELYPAQRFIHPSLFNAFVKSRKSCHCEQSEAISCFVTTCIY